MVRITEECGYVDILPYALSLRGDSSGHNMDFSPTYPLLKLSYPQLFTSYPRSYPPKIGHERQNWLPLSMMKGGILG